MKKILASIFFLLLSSKVYSLDYIQLAGKVRAEFCLKMAKEKKLFTIGTGGAMMDDVKEISLHFVSLDHLNVNEARRLYVEMVEVFLKRVNDDERLRPFLRDYPFTVKNFELSVSFQDKVTFLDEPDVVALVYHPSKEDVLYYKVYNRETKQFSILHEEPYDEALQIVQKEGYLDQISYIEFPSKKTKRVFRK